MAIEDPRIEGETTTKPAEQPTSEKRPIKLEPEDNTQAIQLPATHIMILPLNKVII